MSLQIIWKAKITVADDVIEVPKFAKILCVQVQNGEPHIWFLCNPTAVKEKRKFLIIGTGFEFDADIIEDYIGTFQLDNSALVFHVFETVFI